MPHRIEILQRDEVFHRFVFRIEEVTLRHERFDGAMSGEIKRLILHRGDSVALLLANSRRDEVLLCEQFRLPTYREDGTGWIIELPAGILEEDEAPEECARREAVEETGYDVKNMQNIALVYLSPGGSSERIHIFYAEISEGDRITEGGGLASENEDIKMIWMSLEEARRQCQNGGIQDAKTLIALQWLMLRSKSENQ